MRIVNHVDTGNQTKIVDNNSKTQFESESQFTSIKEPVIGLLGSNKITGNDPKNMVFS